ncbi:MAG: hypothetical protein ACE5H1_06820, partial [Thermodesulfobacteriota bacterium]
MKLTKDDLRINPFLRVKPKKMVWYITSKNFESEEIAQENLEQILKNQEDAEKWRELDFNALWKEMCRNAEIFERLKK